MVEVMVDKVSIVFWLTMAMVCSKHGIPPQESMPYLRSFAALLKIEDLHIEATMQAALMFLAEPDFTEKHQATKEQLLKHLG